MCVLVQKLQRKKFSAKSLAQKETKKKEERKDAF